MANVETSKMPVSGKLRLCCSLVLLTMTILPGVSMKPAANHNTKHHRSHQDKDPSPDNNKDIEDPHGGVPMGVVNDTCDNARDYISLDWDPNSTDEYTCTEGERQGFINHTIAECEEEPKKPRHICYPDQIHYTEDLPRSGPHRPLWPKYGEYKYLPIQRWLHSLEHGGIVFLYHPCANIEEVAKFKATARSCLRRHIISPYKKMPPGVNFVLLSWMCRLTMGYPFHSTMTAFVKRCAMHSPEKSVFANGQYDEGLIHKAKIVSDIRDEELCPDD